MRQRGVSLTELMVVLGLVSLSATLTLESFIMSMTKHQAHAAGAELAAELRTARHLAITRRQRVRVVFEPETARVRTEAPDAGGALLRPILDYSDKGIVVEGLTNGTAVTFYPNGRAASPTTITLRNGRQQRWQLTVSMTGRVSV
jgi:prepilin-type N-terminal cleavage/methylation domain-containing protein